MRCTRYRIGLCGAGDRNDLGNRNQRAPQGERGAGDGDHCEGEVTPEQRPAHARFETREQYEQYKASLRHQEMMRAIEPLIKAKCSALNLMLPTIMIYRDKPFAEVTYSDADKKILAQWDELIRQMADSFK